MGVLDRFRRDGQRAVVTGASRGLGRVMALSSSMGRRGGPDQEKATQVPTQSPTHRRRGAT